MPATNPDSRQPAGDPPGPDRTGRWIDAGLIGLVALLGLWLAEPGVFTVDESHYLLATEAMAERGSFQIENGYEQTRDPSLLYFYTGVPARVEQTGTISSVPPFHALLAAPFFWVAGASGLIWLNLLAFGLCLVAIRRLALRALGSGRLALAAVGVFGLAGFGLEYALGLWPHALSQSLVAWSLLGLLAASGSTRGAWLLLAAGLLLGVATGVRMQNVTLLPAFLLCAAFALRLPWQRWIWLLVGFAGPVTAYSLINSARLGTPNPFTYGTGMHAAIEQVMASLVRHPWLPALPLLALAAAWWVWRRRQSRWVWWGLGIGVAVFALGLPATRAWLQRWLSMAGFHLLDSCLGLEPHSSVGAHFNALGQVLYGGVLKKGLLEAAPWVVLAGLALLPRQVREPLPAPVASLSLVVLAGLAGLLLAVTPGGLCYNPRYLLELLPALSICCVFWATRFGLARPAWLAGALAGLAAAVPVLLHPGRVDAPAGGWWPMLLPLGLAAALLLTALICLAGPRTLRRAAGLVAGGLLVAGLAFGAAVTLAVDLGTSHRVRQLAARIAAEADQALPPAPQPCALLAWGPLKDVVSPARLGRDAWIGGLGPHQILAPSLPEQVLPGRRVFVLTSGMPPEIFQAWFGAFDRRVTIRKGLEFVELRLAGSGP